MKLTVNKGDFCTILVIGSIKCLSELSFLLVVSSSSFFFYLNTFHHVDEIAGLIISVWDKTLLSQWVTGIMLDKKRP